MDDMKWHVDDQKIHQDPKKEVKPISQNLRILVLDDNVIYLKVLVSQLQMCGYQVTSTTQASEALELLRENQDEYDIVITDVVRPDIDGFKLLEIIGLKWGIPVIMTTTNGDIRNVEKGIRHGAREYLVKPIPIKTLQNIWQHAIRKIGHNSNSDAMETKVDGNSNPDRRLQKDEDVSIQSNETLSQKKCKIVWGPELHQKFISAVEQLDADKVVPKKILELMNEPNLTREHVASHLQKYRNSLKKAKENRGQHMTRLISKGKIFPFNNPIIHATICNNGLTINHNNSYTGYGMSSFTGRNHPSMLLNYNGIMNQRLKNMAAHMFQNVASNTTLVADPRLSSMKYQGIQNQRDSNDHGSRQISSQLTTVGVGLELPKSFPNLFVCNSSGTLSMLDSRPYPPSVTFSPAILDHVQYTQTFPASSSSSENQGDLT